MRIRFNKIALFVLILTQTAGAQNQKSLPTIAVLNFAVRGEVSVSQADSLVQKIRSKVIQVAGWPVLTDSVMYSQIPKSSKKTLRAGRQSDADTLGVQLNAAVLIYGVIARLDSVCAMRIFCYDRKSKVMRSKLTGTFDCKIENLPFVVKKLVSEINFGPNNLAQPNDSTGVLLIDATPIASDVYINDEYIGQTPLRIGWLRPGEHNIRLEKGIYKPLRGIVTVTAGETTEYRGILKYDVRITIDSTPSGALIYFNDSPIGKTPKNVRLSSHTPYSLRLEYPGFKPVIQEVQFEKDAHVHVQFREGRKKLYIAAASLSSFGLLYYLIHKKSSHTNEGGGLPAPPGRP